MENRTSLDDEFDRVVEDIASLPYFEGEELCLPDHIEQTNSKPSFEFVGSAYPRSPQQYRLKHGHLSSTTGAAPNSFHFDIHAQPNQAMAALAASSSALMTPYKDDRGNLYDHLSRRCAEAELKPEFNCNASINLTEMVLGGWSPLTRPLLHQNKLVVGTEYPLVRGPGNDLTNTPNLIFGEFKTRFGDIRENSVSSLSDRSVPIERQLTDIQWLTPGESFIYASPEELQLCKWDGRRTLIDKLGSSPDDRERYEVRQIATLPGSDRVVLGDSAQTLWYMRIGQGGQTLQLKHKFSETDEAVGSVSWNLYDINQINYTLDNGTFGICDIRMNHINILYSRNFAWGGRNERLFSHCALSEFMYVLGYEGGKGRVIDIRNGPKNSTITCWSDPIVTDVGELIRANPHDNSSSRFTIACGIGGFTVWDFTGGFARPIQACSPLEKIPVPVVKAGYKTVGSFVPDEPNIFVLTDSCGYVSIYDLSQLND